MRRPDLRAALVLLLLAAPAAGLEPYLVKDINPAASPAGSRPETFAALGGMAVFEASDGSDRVLWASDGTAGGTRVLVDTCPGCPDAVEPLVQAGDQLGERLFFLAYGEPGRKSLWVTDGRTAQRLSGPLTVEREAAWVAAQRVLYFVADGGLWRTDGTPQGTRQALAFPASQLTAFRGRLWFVRGRSLWRSDGTPAGTVLVRRLARALYILGGVDGRLVFAGGDELWSTDGLLARDLGVLDAVVHGGRLWLIAQTRRGQELWVSDGTAARALTAFSRKRAFVDPAAGRYLVLPRSAPDGGLVFAAHDGVHGIEPWVSDGTPAGTRLVRDLCPGPCSGWDAFGLAHRGRAYFTGTDGVHGHELWSTDGAGVELVRDICPGPCGGNPDSLVAFGERVLFAADDGASGVELWTADGRISDFEPRVPWAPLRGAALPGAFLFGADDGEHGPELWATDGTDARLVKDLDDADLGGSFPQGLSALGDTALFFADDGVHGYELWKSDGTAAGTVLAAELLPGKGPFEPPEVRGSAVLGGELFLSLNGALWATDGTAVRKVAQVDARDLVAFQGDLWFTAGGGLWRGGTRIPGPLNPYLLTVHAGRLWLFDDTGLWSSDGTAAVLEAAGRTGSLLASLGSVLIASDPRGLTDGARRIGPAADPGSAWTVFQGRLWYTVANRLWTSDGEESHPVPGAPGGVTFAALGGRLLFTSAGSGIPLWSTDGAETVKIRDLAPGFLGRLDLLAVGPRVFFPALDHDTGLELWAVGP
ncbi:MAG: hypothetical protein ACJ759_03710 [Thermoanaerobaculia bacterium]